MENTIMIQHGGSLQPGLLMFRPNIRRQHGMGLGGFFSKMFKKLIPFAKSVLLPHAVTAARNIADDYLEGKDVKASLKSNALGAIKGVGQQVLDQSGSGRRRGRKRKSSTHLTPTKKFKRRKKKAKANSSKSRKVAKRKSKGVVRKNQLLTLFD